MFKNVKMYGVCCSFLSPSSASDEDSPAKPSTSGGHRSHATAPSTSRGSGSTARAPRSTAAAASNSRTPSGKRRYRKRVDVTSSSSDSDAETGAKVTKVREEYSFVDVHRCGLDCRYIGKLPNEIHPPPL